VGPKTGFLIQGEDRPGAGAELISKLAEAKINVTACDAVAAGEGRYGTILWVKPQDVQKAARVLGAVKEEKPQAAEVGAGAHQASAAGSAVAEGLPATTEPPRELRFGSS
jgi:hypothetical protein